MTLTALILLTLLFIKHWLADFVYQPPYQWQNKGTYGHPGGILHAGQHALLTFIILAHPIWALPIVVALSIAFLEGLIHYHTDWFKMWWNKKQNYTPATTRFWLWLGNDQLIHSLTYIAIAYAALH